MSVDRLFFIELPSALAGWRSNHSSGQTDQRRDVRTLGDTTLNHDDPSVTDTDYSSA